MSEMYWPEITKDTPLTEVKRIHQAIWDYVIEHGKKPDTPYHYDCVACTYDNLYSIDCSTCPIIWPKNRDGENICTGFHGVYTKWVSKTGKEKTELACQIRDLPFKYELEEKKNV